MRMWHISDTHTYHASLSIPPAQLNIDTVIHSGDAATSPDSVKNAAELLGFLDWFRSLPFKNKIFVAGNHDVSIERLRYWPEDIKNMGIHYLENDDVTIEGIKIWGSPYTPTYGQNWAWNVARHKIGRIWGSIANDIDILVTHGPPKGILDYTLDQDGQLVSVGDSALSKAVGKIRPKAHLFGHVHDTKWIKNSGIFTTGGIKYSNGTVIKDGGNKIHCVGNIIDVSR